MESSHFSNFFEGIIALESAKSVNEELIGMLKNELNGQRSAESNGKEPHLYDYYKRTNKKFKKIFPLTGGGIGLAIASFLLIFVKFDFQKLQISQSSFVLSLLFFSTVLGFSLGYGAYKYYVFRKKTKAKKLYKSALDAYYASLNKQNLTASKQNSRLKKVHEALEKVTNTEIETKDTLIYLYNKLTAPFSVRNPRGACIALEQLRERGSLKDYSAVEAFVEDDTYICGAYEDHLNDLNSSIAHFKQAFAKGDSVFNEINEYADKCMALIEELKKY